MSYSNYLKTNKKRAEKLINELLKDFQYVSILGTHVNSRGVVISKDIAITENPYLECGFVIRLYNGKNYSEFSCSELKENISDFAKEIKVSIQLPNKIATSLVEVNIMADEKITKYFERIDTKRQYTDEELVNIGTQIYQKGLDCDPSVVNFNVQINQTNTSKMFLSPNKELEQFYTWTNGILVAVTKEESKMNSYYSITGSVFLEEVMTKLPQMVEETVEISKKLLHTKELVPGVYDIITAPSVTGLIAHEAFGHGVEMDMFVKNRALAKDYLNKKVASPLVNMYDGAAGVNQVASYFFDDDGIIANKTEIIKKGKLITGISDALSSLQLGTIPTGNGRRESYKRKAYSRMTNTYFLPGKDKLEDMIKSIEHGYLLVGTDNGMEDPKNWNIQCAAVYGREITNGELTDNYVSPVVISGYVLDLLKSISMVSKDFALLGGGYCGKGYKEWIPVSDGGPYLKAKVKLG